MANGQEIKEYQKALQCAFDEQYPDMTTTVFKRISEDCKLPAIVINIPVLEPNQAAQAPKEIMRNTVQTSAFVLYSAADEANEIECLQLSVNVANFIDGNRFSMKFPAKVSLNEPMIVEGLEDFIIQRIDFEQNIEITATK